MANSNLSFISSSPMRLAFCDESTAYSDVTITNGYGRCTGVYVTVQKGTTASLNYDFTVKTFSQETFNSLQKSIEKYVKKDVQHYLNEHYSNTKDQAGWFATLFGGMSGSGTEYYINTSEKCDCSLDENLESISKVIYNTESQDIHFCGNLTAIGTSNVPATVSAYIQITTINFADGKSITVLNQETAMVADKCGDTHGATVDENTKLNIVSSVI